MSLFIRILLAGLVLTVPCKADPVLLEIKKDAEAGDVKAQKRLAQYYDGHFQFSEAEHWYKKAAVTGDPEVLWVLGTYYCGGKPRMSGAAGVPFNPTNAIALLSLAALQGHGRAQHDLAVQYNNGTIVPRDKIRAYQLFRLSGGSVGTKFYVDRLILEMSSDELEKAEREVKAFKPKSFKEAFAELVRAQLRLDAIAGKGPKTFAMVNGKMMERGTTASFAVAGIPLEVRCVEIEDRSVRLQFEGGTVTLNLNKAAH